MSDVYERLRARLDELAVGLPESKDKIEIRLLRRLFTETEAIQLVKKADDQLYEPPKSGVETYMRIMQERGKL